MKLKRIELRNFRNYDHIKLSFYSGINILYGINGQGKTNLLESIYFLALTKSHRNFIDNNLIKNDKEFLSVSGVVKRKDKLDISLSLSLKDNKKTMKKDNNKVQKVSDYISNMNVIIFSPDDLELIKGSPQVRRNYLDNELSQLDKNYYILTQQYKKLLKIRNEYLRKMFKKEVVDDNYFSIITDYLIDKAVDIYKLRQRFVDRLNEASGEIFSNISLLDGFKIVYQKNIELESNDSNEIKEYLRKIYQDKHIIEVKNCMTMYGPHKDDLEFILGNNNLKLYGSQGQQRMAVLTLKLSEIGIFKKYLGDVPILLLDDIFSELDDGKKNNLIKYISKDVQTIITTTDLNNLDERLIKKSKLFNVADGKIIKIKEVKENGE